MGEKPQMPQVGGLAPEIDVETTASGRFRLSDHRGKWVVVYFYPRANTPGWTHEAKDFEQHRPQFESLNALVVGVSADKSETQQKFIDKFKLRFPMVPDTAKEVVEAYGARAVLGVAATRSTFLIDPDGRVAATWPKVKIEGHVDDVLKTIERLSGQSADWLAPSPSGEDCDHESTEE